MTFEKMCDLEVKITDGDGDSVKISTDVEADQAICIESDNTYTNVSFDDLKDLIGHLQHIQESRPRPRLQANVDGDRFDFCESGPFGDKGHFLAITDGNAILGVKGQSVRGMVLLDPEVLTEMMPIFQKIIDKDNS